MPFAIAVVFGVCAVGIAAFVLGACYCLRYEDTHHCIKADCRRLTRAALPWLAGFAITLLIFGFLASQARARDLFVASYYGAESGTRTASGERYDPNGLTCAHRHYPFGTRLRVTYRGRSVVCRVNDRGPFVIGRALDLSVGAARVVGLLGAGKGLVTIEVVR